MVSVSTFDRLHSNLSSAQLYNWRLAELEAEEEEIELEIQRLELKAPKLTEGVIRSWLNSFREGDVSDPDFRQKLVDTFIARIDVWNDLVIIYFNMQEKTAASKCSSTARLVDQTGVPPAAQPPFRPGCGSNVPLARSLLASLEGLAVRLPSVRTNSRTRYT